VRNGKPSMLGLATGSIAGLAAITPASGSVGPIGGVSIGLAAGLLCYLASVNIKAKLGYDDSLDVFGVHGVGGVVGTLPAGVFCAAALGGAGTDLGVGRQVAVQAMGVVGAVVYTAVVSFVILAGVRAAIGLRVTDAEESEGLDLTQHEELGYDL
jgi:Amt family ammonium transporter